MRPAPAAPHILVTIPTANFTQRRILEGVLDYARAHGPWLFHLDTGDSAAQDLRRVRMWAARAGGVIALSANARLVDALTRLRLPTVFINPPAAFGRVPKGCVVVRRDQRNLGKLAAEHLLSRGFRQFAFVGSAVPADWSDGRRDGFTARLAREGAACAVYPPPPRRARDDFALEAPRMAAWLARLPRPTALYTVKDMRGQQVLSVCFDAGIRVPEDLAVLSTDNDEILCETTTPQLSSIALDGEQTGRLCARLLDDLLRGRPVEPRVDIAYPRIVTRQSSDACAIEDPVLARALSRVRARLDAPMTLTALAAEQNVSLRTLELKARRHFGKTLREELLRLRLAEGISLLSNTPLPLEDIAARCGFCNASHFSRTVKKVFGHPPGVFRAFPRRSNPT